MTQKPNSIPTAHYLHHNIHKHTHAHTSIHTQFSYTHSSASWLQIFCSLYPNAFHTKSLRFILNSWFSHVSWLTILIHENTSQQLHGLVTFHRIFHNNLRTLFPLCHLSTLCLPTLITKFSIKHYYCRVIYLCLRLMYKFLQLLLSIKFQ